MSEPTASVIARVFRAHQQNPGDPDVCFRCEEIWPCDAYVIASTFVAHVNECAPEHDRLVQKVFAAQEAREEADEINDRLQDALSEAYGKSCGCLFEFPET